MRASPEIEHVKGLDVLVTQFSPLETVIVAPPKLEVKVIDRVVAALTTRVTDAVVVLELIEMSVCVTYPVRDAV